MRQPSDSLSGAKKTMINLLPQPYRKRLGQERRFRLILVLGVSFFISLVSLSIFLLLIQVALANERSSLESQLVTFAEKTKQEDSTLGEIRSWNAKLESIKQFKEERQSVQEALSQLASSLPPELSLLSFSYTPSSEAQRKDDVIKTPASIAVTGSAPTRDQLLSFKDALQANLLFTNVVFPPSNWVSPADISFSFQAKIRERRP